LVVLTGVRPEELADWPVAPAQALSFASPTDSQDKAVGAAIDQARRVAARGGDAVVLIDTLDGPHPQPARKALAAARNLTDAGSVTVIGTASAPLGGETTVIALDGALAAAGKFPALDLAASGTIRPELLVGEDGAAAIVAERLASQ
jgi:transcription termination factor Rho